MNSSPGKLVPRLVSAAIFISAGVLHFVTPAPFIHIVPPSLPAPEWLVAVSGVFEILGGVGILVPRLRRASGWGLLALLIAVYPANIHMLVNDVYLPGAPEIRWTLWARMPLQFVAAWLVWLGAGLQWRDFTQR